MHKSISCIWTIAFLVVTQSHSHIKFYDLIAWVQHFHHLTAPFLIVLLSFYSFLFLLQYLISPIRSTTTKQLWPKISSIQIHNCSFKMKDEYLIRAVCRHTWDQGESVWIHEYWMNGGNEELGKTAHGYFIHNSGGYLAAGCVCCSVCIHHVITSMLEDLTLLSTEFKRV